MGIRAGRGLFAALGAVALSVMLASQALGASTWTDPVNVWTPPVAADHWAVPIGLVAVDDSTAVAGYIRFNPGSTISDIFVRKTVDNGQVWTAPLQVSLPGAGSSDASIAGYGQNVDIAWPGVRYSRSVDGGSSFSDPVTLPNSDGAYVTVVARGADGTVAIAWAKANRHGSKVFVAVSRDGGVSFGARQLLWTKSVTVFPAVAVGDGMIYVAASPDVGTIKLRRSVDGNVWSDPVSMGAQYFGSGMARLTLAAEGNEAYVAYDRLTDQGFEAAYRRTTDLGATWSSRKRFAGPSGAISTPLLSMHNGIVGVTFARGYVSNSQAYTETVYRETSDGTNWTPLEHVSQQPVDSSGPGGIAHTDRTLIYYSYYNPGSYGVDLSVTSRTDP